MCGPALASNGDAGSEVKAPARAAVNALVLREDQRLGADDVLEVIVERAGGDLRSAINDLESLAVGRRTIVAEATEKWAKVIKFAGVKAE